MGALPVCVFFHSPEFHRRNWQPPTGKIRCLLADQRLEGNGNEPIFKIGNVTTATLLLALMRLLCRKRSWPAADILGIVAT